MYSAVITIINKKGYKANYREIVKDGIKRKAIEIGYPDMNIRPVIYVDAISGADNMAYEELAEKIARTVIKTRKSVTLEPMSAYERKIIHSKLQNSNKVKTYSIGEEPRRKVVISLK